MMVTQQSERPVLGELSQRRVSRIERQTDDSVTITFESDENDADAVPGQHITVRRHFAGEDVRRSYSICSTRESPELRIGVRRITNGRMSTWLTETLHEGDWVEIGPPTGDFGRHVVDAAGSTIALVGAGSGVTPLVSILANHLRSDPASNALLILGNRTGSSAMLAEDLAALKDRYTSRLHIIHVLTRENRGVPAMNGRLDTARIVQLVEQYAHPGTIAQWFLCGPRDVVDEAREAALTLGADPANVHRELFFAEPTDEAVTTAPMIEGATVVVTLNGQTSTLPADQIQGSILESLLAQRSDAPFACKSGVCGTCRARCVSGEVRMRTNYALEDSELDAGIILTCQAMPASDRVELEYL